MKNRPTIKLFFLSVFSLFLSCEEEQLFNAPEQRSEIQLTAVQIFQSTFDLDKFEDPAEQIVNNVEVDWNTFTRKTIGGVEWYEFKIDESKPVGYEKAIIKGYNYTLLAALGDNGDPKLYLNKMLSYSDDRANSFFDIKAQYFHGLVYLYAMTGHTDYLQHYQKGRLISQFEDDDVKPSDISPIANKSDCMKKTDLTARCDTALECALNGGNNTGSCGGGDGGGPPTGGGYRTVTTHHYTDWYNVRRNGTKEYSNTQYQGSTREYVWVSGNQRGDMTTFNYATREQNGRMTHTRQRPRNAVERPYKLIMDKSLKKSPCVVDIINKLQQKDMQRLTVPDIGGLSGTGHLSQGILNMFKNSKRYNLNIKVAEAGSNKNASTIGKNINGKFVFTITLDEEYVKKGTKLAIARTLIHESMHAYLGYVLQEYYISDTAQLLREYNRKFENENIAEHTFMAQYVEAIGYSLSVWANDIHNPEYYQNLAWSGGLIGTEAFNELSDEKQTAIRNANRAEGDAVNRANGNARGTKCN